MTNFLVQHKMTSYLPIVVEQKTMGKYDVILCIVVEQKTIVLQYIGGRLYPLAPQVSATGKNTQGLGPESQGFSKLIVEISRLEGL